MSDLQNATEAAGLIHHAFADNKHPTNSNHPVYRYFVSQPPDRQITLNDHQTHGVLVVNSNYQVTIISLPKCTMDLNSGKKFLSGLIGNNCSYATPVHMNTDIINNVLTLSTADEEVEGLNPVPEFSTRTEKKRFNIPDNMGMFQVPIVLPLFGDIDIIQGHIANKDVRQSISDYHPVAKIWAEAVHYQSKDTDSNFQQTFQSIASKLSNLNASGSFVCCPEITISSDPELFQRLEKVRSINKESYYNRFPEQRPPSANMQSHSENIELLDMSDPTDNHSSATMRKMKLKIESISPPIKLFFAVVNEQTQEVVAPTVNAALEGLYQKSRSLTDFVSQFRKALTIHTKQHCQHRDYLNRSVEMPHLQEITITKFLKMDFKMDALDDKLEFIDKQLSVLCFSPPPYPGRNSKYNQFLQSSLNASLEEEIEQNEKHCEKKSTISFVDGRKENLNDIISTIANIVCIAEFKLNSPAPPLIVTQLIEFADIISSSEYKQWYYKHRQGAPWIPHTLLTLLHSIIVGFAEVSSHYQHVNTLADLNEMPSFSVYEGLVDSFKMVKLHLTSGLKQQSLGNFTSPPRSYTLTCNEDKKGKDGSNKKARTTESETGWLKYTGHKKFPDLPPLRECRMCKEYVTIGMSCAKRNHPRCRYGVHVSFQRLTKEDKRIISEYCNNSRTLSLALEG